MGGSGAGGGGKGRGSGGRPKKSKTAMEPGPSSTTSTSTSSVDQYLLNPVVLANLFKVFPHNLLATSRFVCKTWYRESLVPWRSTSSLIILRRLRKKDEIYVTKSEDLNLKYRYRRNDSDSEQGKDEGRFNTRLKTFLAFLQQECRSKPYRQFCLSYWSFAPPPSSENPASAESIQNQQDRFWELVGANVTFLKLSKCTFQDATAFRKIVFQTCPNLKTLILHNCRSLKPFAKSKKPSATQYQAPAYGEQINLKSLSVSRSGDQDQGLPISYLELLSHFPSLTSINLTYSKLLEYNDTNADTNDLMEWINAIKVIRQHDADKLALQKFSTGPGFQLGHSAVHSYFGSVPADHSELGHSEDPAICRDMCSLFHEMDLQPELLVVQLHSDVVAMLEDILLLSGKSIKKIKAVKDGGTGGCCGSRPTPVSKGFPCEFPFGMELANLTELTLSPNFCRSLEFLKWTPNLEKLEIIRYQRERGHRGTTVDTMILNTSEELMADVKLLKLKELWMGFRIHDVEEMRRLCGWMPNLEIATMFVDDEQFGIVCENWKKLKHIHVFGSRLGDKGITGMGFKGYNGLAVVRPNITLLKELNCFQFAMLDSQLSDTSIYNGFLKLPKLHTLEIASNRSKIGKEAMKAIHEKVPNCHILGSREMVPEDVIGGDFLLRKRYIRCGYFR